MSRMGGPAMQSQGARFGGYNTPQHTPYQQPRQSVPRAAVPTPPENRGGDGQGYIYSGQIEKGQMHGKGTLVYPNGETSCLVLLKCA